MAESSTSTALIIVIFFTIGFPLLWVVIAALSSLASGWWSLSGKFRAETPAAEANDNRVFFGTLGWWLFPAQYSNVLYVTVDPAGIYLSIHFLFRVMHPPLFIPWASIESVVDKRFLVFDCARIRIRDSWPALCLYGQAGRAVLAKWRQRGRSGD